VAPDARPRCGADAIADADDDISDGPPAGVSYLGMAASAPVIAAQHITVGAALRESAGHGP
jgi:hypothetical protein